MTKARKSFLLYICLAAWMISTVFPAGALDLQETATGEYRGFLVGFAETSDVQLFEDNGTDVLRITDTVGWVPDWEQAEKLSARHDVEYVEPNYIADLFDEIDSEQPVDHGWSYDAVNAGTAAAYGLTGSGVRIGLIDSGVDLDNPDLQDAVIGDGYDYVLGTSAMCDDIYHGTCIAQVISGSANARGVTGIAPGAEIIPLRCFSRSDGGGDVMMLSQAIYDAVDIYRCDIISMSWGVKGISETLRNAIQYAYDAGVVLVASAGNVDYNYPLGTTIYPACYDEVISVASVNASLVRSGSSQTHEMLTVCAPGADIPFVLADGTEVCKSGTSFAVPCVTAEAAILLQLAPVMEPADVMKVITERATDLGDPGHDTFYGYGLLEIDSLLGDGWSELRRESGGDRDTIRVYGWRTSAAEFHVAVVAYDGNKRMTDQYLQSCGPGTTGFDCVFDLANTDAVRIFCLDSDYAPLLDCERLSTAEQIN